MMYERFSEVSNEVIGPVSEISQKKGNTGNQKGGMHLILPMCGSRERLSCVD
jgi:hypothetical protein